MLHVIYRKPREMQTPNGEHVAPSFYTPQMLSKIIPDDVKVGDTIAVTSPHNYGGGAISPISFMGTIVSINRKMGRVLIEREGVSRECALLEWDTLMHGLVPVLYPGWGLRAASNLPSSPTWLSYPVAGKSLDAVIVVTGDDTERLDALRSLYSAEREVFYKTHKGFMSTQAIADCLKDAQLGEINSLHSATVDVSEALLVAIEARKGDALEAVEKALGHAFSEIRTECNVASRRMVEADLKLPEIPDGLMARVAGGDYVGMGNVIAITLYGRENIPTVEGAHYFATIEDVMSPTSYTARTSSGVRLVIETCLAAAEDGTATPRALTRVWINGMDEPHGVPAYVVLVPVVDVADAPTYIRNCAAENYFQIRVRQISGDFARELRSVPYDLDSLIGNGQGLYAGWSRFDAHPSEVLSNFDEIRAQVLEDTLGYVSDWVDDQVAAPRDALGKYVCALERLYDAR